MDQKVIIRFGRKSGL